MMMDSLMTSCVNAFSCFEFEFDFCFVCFVFCKISGEIERAVYSGILEPSADWHSLTHEGSGVNSDLRLTYRVRVQCEPNYYNATCTKFCRPRNDMFGHYECDRNGDKTCMSGWTGATCETGRL
jgi:jagged-like protein